MISFASPFVLGLAAAAALVVVGIHLLSVRRPQELLLPTARFLPAAAVRAVSRTKTPSDLLLLALRMVCLLAAGIALAGPRFTPSQRARIALVVVEPGVAADSAAIRLLLRNEPLATGARVVVAAESLPAPTSTSAAAFDPAQSFPRAVQVATRTVIADPSVDSIVLVLLRSGDNTDLSGWAAWRSAWPGAVVTYSPPLDSLQSGAARTMRRIVIAPLVGSDLGSDLSPADDVVRVALAWHAARLNARRRIERANPTRVDSIFVSRQPTLHLTSSASASPGRVDIHWPEDGMRAAAGDSASALVAGGTVMMGPWSVTTFVGPTTGTRVTTSAAIAQPFAWWSDGRVAAIERFAASRCERTVAVAADQGHDVLLSPSANALFDRLLAPCLQQTPAAVSALRVRTVDGRTLAPAGAFRVTDRDADIAASSRWSRWTSVLLLGLALLALFVEWRMRRLPGGAPV